MSDIDDDAPPPLDSLDDQVRAVKVAAGVLDAATAGHRGAACTAARAGGSGGAEEDEEEHLPVASTVAISGSLCGAAQAQRPARAAIRRGFFDAKPKPKQQTTSGPSVPLLRTKPRGPATTISSGGGRGSSSSGAGGARGAIPDFLMLPPDERQRARDQLVDALRPTPTMLSQISSDPVLAAGFQDPEVMAAVAEVAADPAAIAKHKGNAKVMRFYASMGQLVGGRLEEVGAAGDGGTGGAAGGGGGGGGGAGGAAARRAQGKEREALGGPSAAAGGLLEQRQQQQCTEVRWR